MGPRTAWLEDRTHPSHPLTAHHPGQRLQEAPGCQHGPRLCPQRSQPGLSSTAFWSVQTQQVRSREGLRRV